MLIDEIQFCKGGFYQIVQLPRDIYHNKMEISYNLPNSASKEKLPQ